MKLRPELPVYLRNIALTTEKKDGETRKVVQCALLIAPFTSEMAEELTPGLREHLFRRDTGDPLEQLAEAKFRIPSGLQQVRIKLAPDMPDNSVRTLDNVRVDAEWKFRRDKETPTIEASLWIDFVYPPAEMLLFLANNQNEQIIVSFYETQANLIDEEMPKEPKLRKTKKEAPAEEPVLAEQQ